MTATPPPSAAAPLLGAFNAILRQLQRINVSMRRMTPGNQPVQQYGLGLNLEYRTVRLFHNIISQVDELQKKSLGVGMNLDDSFSRVSQHLVNLPGGIVAGMDSSLEAFHAGFKEPTAAILKLAVQSRTAGQSTPKMLAILSRIEEFGRFSVDNLSNTIRNFVTTYGINSETLVDALGDLSKEFPKFSIVGISEQMSLGVTELISALGPEFKEPVLELVKGLTQVGIEGATTAARLGASQERLALQTARSSREVITALVSVANKSSTSLQRFIPEFGDKFTGMGIGMEVLGADFLAGAAIINNKITSMGGQFLKAIQENTIYANSFSNFLNQLYDPFYTLAMVIGPKIIQFLSQDWLKEMSQIFAGAITVTIGRGILGRLLGLAGGAAGATFGGGVLISTAIVALSMVLKKMFGEAEETATNTSNIADSSKRAEHSNFMASEYSKQIADRNQKAFESITTMNAATLEAIKAKDQTDQFNKLIDAVNQLGEKLEGRKVPILPTRGR